MGEDVETLLAGNSQPPVVDGSGPGPAVSNGTVLAERYRVLGRLGAGGMGTVYLAEHTTIGKRFAIKMLNPEFCAKPEAIERFLREAKTASQLSHPNVVEIIDFGFSTDELPFFVMEKLEGEELEDAAEREGPMPWARVRPILTQILAALDAAHAVGVVHRDMKPANCFLVRRPDGGELVKVLDFGIAKVIDDDPEFKTLTQTGAVMGSVHYMSPEQARGERVDLRSDIYSTGVVAYKLLTNEVPYDATGVVGVLSKLLLDDYPPMATVAPHVRVHPRIEAVVRRAMAKNRDDRFASAAAFAAALRELPEDLAAPPGSAAAPSPGSTELAPLKATPLVRMQVSSQPRVALADVPREPAVRQGRTAGARRRRSFLGRLLVLGLVAAGVGAAILYVPQLRSVRDRATEVSDELSDELSDQITRVGIGDPDEADDQLARDRYASLVTAAANAHGVELSLDQLREPNTFLHTITPRAPKKLAPSKSLREGPLSLRARSETRDKNKHTLVEIHNEGSVPVAYRVEAGAAGGGKCSAPVVLAHDALVLDPGQKVRISVCSGRRNLEIVDLRTLELTSLGAALVRKLPPRAAGLSAAEVRAHNPGRAVVQCSAQPETAAGLDDGDYAWEDVIDFFSRHDCDHYAWWSGYRRAVEPIESLPILGE